MGSAAERRGGLKKYGKKLGGLLRFKSAMFEENAGQLDAALASARLYASQPPRRQCKICRTALPDTPLFTKHGVPYALCPQCGHLNGLHEDTDDFLDRLYVRDSGKSYGANYVSEHGDEYRARVKEIYAPKADFLLAALREEGCEPATLGYADLGAGAGYFVSALSLAGIEKVEGFEVSASQVALGSEMLAHLGLSSASLRQIRLDELAGLVRQSTAAVVSMVGVLEHLQNPTEILGAIRENPNIRYLFVSVPLFSLSVMVEAAFPHVFPRHLAIGHTHLFTRSSLDWLAWHYGFEVAAEWWFGADMTDIYRSLLVSLQGNEETRGLAPVLTEQLYDALDDLQLCLDRRNLSSEVHLVYRVHPS
jgi:hypothetical protein